LPTDLFIGRFEHYFTHFSIGFFDILAVHAKPKQQEQHKIRSLLLVSPI
jgi:hypothetical protein